MSKREVIEPHKGDKRYARRDSKGQFTDSQVNVGRSLAAMRQRAAFEMDHWVRPKVEDTRRLVF